MLSGTISWMCRRSMIRQPQTSSRTSTPRRTASTPHSGGPARISRSMPMNASQTSMPTLRAMRFSAKLSSSM
ncbi:hypothetical protein C532_17925 [Pseudomonas aeruginosa P37]|nr:hypothetical protein C532_17925 [Pseudomonas aeruginosa P37]